MASSAENTSSRRDRNGERAHLRRRKRKSERGDGSADGGVGVGGGLSRRAAAAEGRCGMETEMGDEPEIEAHGAARYGLCEIVRSADSASHRGGKASPSASAARDEDEGREDEARLMLWAELAPWQQHGSELILTGYRKLSGSAWACLRSWGYLHNETVNIHSHLAGALLFAVLLAYLACSGTPPRYRYRYRYEYDLAAARAAAPAGDLAVCAVYFAGVAVCFVLSAAFHTLSSHSEQAYRAGMRADVRGILLLMWSATVPLVHFSFPPSSSSPSSPSSLPRPLPWLDLQIAVGWREAYWALTTALALACAAAVSRPHHPSPSSSSSSASSFPSKSKSPSPLQSTSTTPDPWGRRAALFALFGVVSFAAPIAHGAFLHYHHYHHYHHNHHHHYHHHQYYYPHIPSACSSPADSGSTGDLGHAHGRRDYAPGHAHIHGPSYSYTDLIGGAPWLLATVTFNTLGFVAYTLRFPERWFPRTFDLVGASHQLMHVAVLAAALSWAVAVVRAFDLRHGAAVGGGGGGGEPSACY